MNIIVVPAGARKGYVSSLPHRHLLVIALVGGLVLPLFLGTLTFEIRELIAKGERARAEVSAYEAELVRQANAIERAKRDTATHLNALARRLGQLQAQVLRLNALGGRLTQMAGLDEREFAFEAEVAQGGPEAPTSGASREVTGALERLGAEVRAAEARLKALETLGEKIARRDAIARVGSAGRSTGPHVQVEVLREGKQVNPARYLRRDSLRVAHQ